MGGSADSIFARNTPFENEELVRSEDQHEPPALSPDNFVKANSVVSPPIKDALELASGLKPATPHQKMREFFRERRDQVVECPICKRPYKYVGAECLVAHGDNECCHYSQICGKCQQDVGPQSQCQRCYDPIPGRVYYRAGNFYCDETQKGMGNVFYAKWKDRCAEFPTEPSPAGD